MRSLEQSIVKLFCPNCAYKIIGYTNETGLFKTKCNCCGILITSMQKRFKKEKIISIKEN